MTRDGEIPAIFNPKRVRTPSVVVTGESPNGPFGGFTNIINNSDTGGNPPITHSDSLTSNQADGSESGGGGGGGAGGYNASNISGSGTGGAGGSDSGGDGGGGGGIGTIRSSSVLRNITGPSSILGSAGGGSTITSGGIATLTGPSNINNTSIDRVGADTPSTEIPQTENAHSRRLKACKESCCSDLAQKMYFGVCVTILVTASWVGATHCIKFLYLNRTAYTSIPQNLDIETESDNSSRMFHIPKTRTTITVFNAPFFASWFCTNFAFLFFPIYLMGRVAVRKCDKPREILDDVLRGFRDRGFTIARFLNRCLSFCLLWILTTYLYALSLRSLYATDVMALFATNVASVYLLSWVILHEQFVGVRIVAVILCDTGIALLAYMDGITGSPTLGGVVLAALAAAGYAVFKVMFRKVMGDPPVGQIAFTFTTLGFLNAALLWPICLALYFTGTEVMPLDRLPWIILLIASVLLLVFHILTQFSAAVTYNMFVTLGLITAVPVSGALDVVLYGAQFAGMKLAGVILIAVGFFLVMFPENWPDYITRLLRNIILLGHNASRPAFCRRDIVMGSRSPQRFSNGPTSYRHRLSDGIHSFPSSLTVRSCEMTDLSPNFQNYQQHLQQQQSINSNIQDGSFESNTFYTGENRQSSPHQFVTTASITTANNNSCGTEDCYSGVSNKCMSSGRAVAGSSNSGGGATGGRFFSSYFGGDDTSVKRKSSETTFFSLGFRRKSSAYYAATD